MVALHAALLAGKAQAAGPDDLRAARGHRRHDQAPPGDRPASDRRDPRRPAHRPGHRGRHGRRGVLHADAGRAVARRAPRRRAVSLPERPDPRPGDPDQHPAQRRLPRLRRAAGRVRRRDAPQPDRRGARARARSRSGGATSTSLGDTTPTGQVLRESVAGEEVLERAAEAAEFERLRAPPRRGPRAAAPDPARCPASPLRTGREPFASGDRPRARLARRRVHRHRRGQARLGRVARADRRGRDPDPHRVDGDGPGQPRRSCPQLVAEALGIPVEVVEPAAQDTAFVPDSGPTVASRTAMVVGGLLIKAARRLRAEVEAATGGSFAATYRDFAPDARPAADRPALRAVSRTSRSTTRPTAATPTRPSAGPPASPASTSISTPARCSSATWSPPMTSAGSSTRCWPRARSKAARSRPSATPPSRRSSCATAGTSTTAWRPT